MEERAARPVSKAGTRFLLAWAIGLICLYGALGVVLVRGYAAARSEDSARHRSRTDQRAHDREPADPDAQAPGAEKRKPREVQVGIYLDRIVEASPKESAWTADFYIWFNWTDPDLSPGETFQVIDGRIESREKIAERTTPEGRYALYRVMARVTKFFTLTRFPVEDHLLTIPIEDSRRQAHELRYVPDEGAAQISSRVRMQGFVVFDHGAVVRSHSYKTRRGDPALSATYRATYSQYVFAVWVKRPGAGTLFRVTFGLFAAVAIALVSFFIRPTEVDPRFGIGIGAFFAAVANAYVGATMLPDSCDNTLADTMNSIGLLTIFLVLVESAISLHVLSDLEQEELSRRLDRISFLVILAAYIALSAALPLVASI